MIKKLVLLCLVTLNSGCTTLPPIVERTASYTLPDIHGTQLAELVNKQSTRHPDQSGVVLLDSGHEAFISRIALADAAERSLDAQYYIWNADLTGRLLADRLLQAAERGVRVRLLLDDYGAGNKDNALIALDTHPQIEVRVYNPFHAGFRSGLRKLGSLVAGFGRLNRRMHSKTYIADGSMAIVGGRNIGDEYFGLHGEANFRDLELIVGGKITLEVSAAFDAYWNDQWSFPIDMVSHVDASPVAGHRPCGHRYQSAIRCDVE